MITATAEIRSMQRPNTKKHAGLRFPLFLRTTLLRLLKYFPQSDSSAKDKIEMESLIANLSTFFDGTASKFILELRSATTHDDRDLHACTIKSK